MRLSSDFCQAASLEGHPIRAMPVQEGTNLGGQLRSLLSLRGKDLDMKRCMARFLERSPMKRIKPEGDGMNLICR